MARRGQRRAPERSMLVQLRGTRRGGSCRSTSSARCCGSARARPRPAAVPSISTPVLTIAARMRSRSRRRLSAGLGDHHQPLGAARRVGAAERPPRSPRRTPATSPAALSTSCGMMLRPARMMHVLAPAGDEDLAIRQVAEVAGVQPVRRDHSPRRFGIAEVAAGRRRAAELAPPLVRSAIWFRSSTTRISCRGQRLPQATKRQTRASPGAAGHRAALRSNVSRSIRSIRGHRPSGGNASATDGSARP